jgi:hypothetical protein
MEHLAIMDRETIDMVLNNEKAIESRFSKNKITPFNMIKSGDTVYLKESGKDVSAMFEAGDVEFYDNLNQNKIQKIKDKYNMLIKADDSYWNLKLDSKYGTLIHVKNAKRILPIKIQKRGRQGFISFNNIKIDLIENMNVIEKNKSDCINNRHLLILNNNYLMCKICGENIINRELLKQLPLNYELVFNELIKSKWNYDWLNFKIFLN